MRRTSRAKSIGIMLLAAATLVAGAGAQPAHRDPCHLHHVCPSDHHTYAWHGLWCTSYADERLASDTKTVVYGGRTYWCHGTASGGAPAPPSSAPAVVKASWTLTPGALNPAVTQSAVQRTICVSGYSASIRPPVSYTEPLKLRQMREYRETGTPREYEEDHLIPLELGGAPRDPRNLWPESRPRADVVDGVENSLHNQVCSGATTLAAAQREISALKHGSG